MQHNQQKPASAEAASKPTEPITNMQAPPEAKQQLVNPPVGNQFIFKKNRPQEVEGPRTVRIEAIEEIRIDDELLMPGDQALVSERVAKDFCKEYDLNYSFGGERAETDSPRYKRTRAKRVG